LLSLSLLLHHYRFERRKKEGQHIVRRGETKKILFWNITFRIHFIYSGKHILKTYILEGIIYLLKSLLYSKIYFISSRNFILKDVFQNIFHKFLTVCFKTSNPEVSLKMGKIVILKIVEVEELIACNQFLKAQRLKLERIMLENYFLHPSFTSCTILNF